VEEKIERRWENNKNHRRSGIEEKQLTLNTTTNTIATTGGSRHSTPGIAL
jgi:hypothetical protein